MDLRAKFKGRVPWISFPSTLSGVIGACLAAAFGAATLELPRQTLTVFFGATAVVLAVLVPVGEFRLRRRLRPLKRLGLDEGSPSREQLVSALRAAAALPDFVFISAIQLWGVGIVAVATSYALLVPSTGWVLVVRILLLGLLFGPMTALVSHLMSLGRARKVVELVAEAGVPPADVVAALPRGRQQLRRRFIAVSALAVLMPAIASADLALVFSQRSLARVAAISNPTERQLVAQEVRTEVRLAGLAMLALVGAFAGVVALVVGKAVADPIRRIAESAARVAAGEQVPPAVVSAEDELWSVSAAFTTMQIHLGGALGELRRAGIQIGSTTEEIVATSGRYEVGATDQASSLNETSATTEELARSARQIAENATSVSELAQKTLDSAQSAQKSADAFSAAMSRMKQDNHAIAEAVARLSLRVQQIGKIVEFINGVADKSDLLALNAELEGTKAGEVGRTFALVAAEMRRLAENVIESTNEIEELIEEIRGATLAAVGATEGGMRATDGGMGMADSVSQSLGQVTSLAQKTSEAVKSITVSTQHQQGGTDQLAQTMADILRVTHQGLEATRQVRSANVDLAALAKELRVVVEGFDTRNG